MILQKHNIRTDISYLSQSARNLRYYLRVRHDCDQNCISILWVLHHICISLIWREDCAADDQTAVVVSYIEIFTSEF